GVEVGDPADHRGAGDEVVTVGQQPGHQVDVARIALDELVVRVVVVGLGDLAVLGEVVDTHHGVAARQEFLDQVAADESSGPADQYLLHRHLVSFWLSAAPVRFWTSSRLSLRPNANRYHRRYLGIQAATRKLDSPSCRSSQIVGIWAT